MESTRREDVNKVLRNPARQQLQQKVDVTYNVCRA